MRRCTTMAEMVWLSGHLVPAAEATVPVFDRGLMFGDGVYEAYRLYRGRPFRLTAHLERLARSAAGIRLELPDVDWARELGELVAANGLEHEDGTVYLQVNRGAPVGRGHAFPAGVPVTAFAIAGRLHAPSPAHYEEGAAAVTRPDLRWGRVDIKSINLLANVLASQGAAEEGAWEAVLVRDGVVTEGSRTNVFAVFEGRLHTHPESPRILGGITRAAVLEVARDAGLTIIEEPIPAAALPSVDELFLTGTTVEVLPLTRVDDYKVGDGVPGPVTRRLMQGLALLIQTELSG